MPALSLPANNSSQGLSLLQSFYTPSLASCVCPLVLNKVRSIEQRFNLARIPTKDARNPKPIAHAVIVCLVPCYIMCISTPKSSLQRFRQHDQPTKTTQNLLLTGHHCIALLQLMTLDSKTHPTLSGCFCVMADSLPYIQGGTARKTENRDAQQWLNQTGVASGFFCSALMSIRKL